MITEHSYIFRKSYNFKIQNSFEQTGKAHIRNWFYDLPYFKDVEDKTNDMKYKKKDIDFILYLENPENGGHAEIPIRVQVDKYTAPNFFFETKRKVKENIPGRMFTTESRVLIYYFITLNKCYLIDTKGYTKWFKENFKKNRWWFTKKIIHYESYDTMGFVFPIEFVEDEPFMLGCYTVFKDID